MKWKNSCVVSESMLCIHGFINPYYLVGVSSSDHTHFVLSQVDMLEPLSALSSSSIFDC